MQKHNKTYIYLLVCAVVFFLVSIPEILLAASHYVRQGAAGTGTGANWTNACTDFTGSCAVSSLVRGDTYYVAAGTYGSRTFNKAISGTTVITIKRATVADHGIETGWSGTYDDHVTWGFPIQFDTNYWVFDGVTAPATADIADAADWTKYGFSVDPSGASCGNNSSPINIGANYLTIKNISLPNTCGKPDVALFGVQVGYVGSSGGCSNLFISHTFAENNITDFQRNSTPLCDNNIFEYHHSRGQYTATAHGEVYALGGDKNTIRYNYYESCVGTGCIASNGPALTNFKIYGNIMNHVLPNSSSGNGAIVGAGAAGTLSGFEIYNNTIIGTGGAYGWFYTNGGSGNNIVKNNIVYGRCNTNMGGSNNVADSNTYLSCWASPNAETNRQTGSFDPFVSSLYGSPGVGNYRLKPYTAAACSSTSTLCAGTSLSSLYNLDMDGNARGTDGVWDRGAFEFQSENIPPPIKILIRPLF